MSPATKLFQDPVSRAVIGVEIDKAGETVNIRAKNGVVMTMGGFENNRADGRGLPGPHQEHAGRHPVQHRRRQ
ncbi:MAG: hypothetical protein ACLTDR_00705 [Adlercreutzia equolifaciens]